MTEGRVSSVDCKGVVSRKLALTSNGNFIGAGTLNTVICWKKKKIDR